MNAPAKSTNLWPFAIITWFIVFISAMALWIVYAVRQNVDLVRRDYYEEEIRFQQQLDRINRTQPLRSEAKIVYDAAQQFITVALPASQARRLKGSICFYRPADAKLDRTLPLSLASDGIQHIDTRILRAGLWKVYVQWTADGQEYFFDETVVIRGG